MKHSFDSHGGETIENEGKRQMDVTLKGANNNHDVSCSGHPRP